MMKIEMPKLAYATTALEPVISEQTINFHYGKHLQNYVNTLGSLVKDTEWEGKSVEEIVEGAPEGPLFNNAGQVLNHALYFDQFRAPRQNNLPTGKILDAINDTFGSFDNFKAHTDEVAVELDASLNAVLEGVAGMDRAFTEGEQDMVESTRAAESSSDFDAARFGTSRA